MTPDLDLIVTSSGDVKCIYGEVLALHLLGKLTIKRASHVEPDAQGQWLADMGPSGGPVLGPFLTRSLALAAEHQWLSAAGF